LSRVWLVAVLPRLLLGAFLGNSNLRRRIRRVCPGCCPWLPAFTIYWFCVPRLLVIIIHKRETNLNRPPAGLWAVETVALPKVKKMAVVVLGHWNPKLDGHSDLGDSWRAGNDKTASFVREIAKQLGGYRKRRTREMFRFLSGRGEGRVRVCSDPGVWLAVQPEVPWCSDARLRKKQATQEVGEVRAGPGAAVDGSFGGGGGIRGGVRFKNKIENGPPNGGDGAFLMEEEPSLSNGQNFLFEVGWNWDGFSLQRLTTTCCCFVPKQGSRIKGGMQSEKTPYIIRRGKASTRMEVVRPWWMVSSHVPPWRSVQGPLFSKAW